MEKVSVLAITKNGIKIGEKLKGLYPNWDIFAPEKLSNKNNEIIWYSEGTTNKIIESHLTSQNKRINFSSFRMCSFVKTRRFITLEFLTRLKLGKYLTNMVKRINPSFLH